MTGHTPRRAAAIVAVVAAVALLVCSGGIVASNMGFKVRYRLVAGGGGESASGTNYIGLPYVPKPGMVTVRDLFKDIGVAQSIFHQKIDGAFEGYTFGGGSIPPNGWNLIPGEGLIVKVGVESQYRLVGSHDPTVAVELSGGNHPGGASGTNLIAVPYHTTAQNARELFREIGGSIQLIYRHRKIDDAFEQYTSGGGTIPPNGWDLVSGESYLVKVGQDQTWMPSHY